MEHPIIHPFVLIIGVDYDHRLGLFLLLSVYFTVFGFFECFIRFLGFSYILVILPEWKWPLLPLDQKFLLPLSLLLSSALCPNLWDLRANNFCLIVKYNRSGPQENMTIKMTRIYWCFTFINFRYSYFHLWANSAVLTVRLVPATSIAFLRILMNLP